MQELIDRFPIRPGDIEALQRLYQTFWEFGSLDPSADFQALMKHDTIRHLAAIEPFRCLMEPVFRLQPGEGLAVTVFRTLRDTDTGTVYNWLKRLKCYPASFEDVALVVEQARKDQWRVYRSDIRRRRIYFPDPDEIWQEQMVAGDTCSFEYTYIPDDLDPSKVERSGLTSQTIFTNDYVITWRFPQDPVRQWHE